MQYDTSLLWPAWLPGVALPSAVLLAALAWRRPALRRAMRLPLAGLLLCWLLAPLQIPPGLLPPGGYWLPALLVLVAGILLLRLWGLILFHLLLPWLGWRPPRIIEDIFVSLCYLAWGLLRLHSAGVELGQIVATSAVITAVLAFAMQDTLGNLLAGVAIQLDDSLRIGDWVEIDKTSGRVVEINWRATSIETRNWETVIIPNSMLLKQRFTIQGRRRGQPQLWRRWVWFDITLDTLPTQIIQLVEKSLREASLPGIASEPAPNCVLMSVENGIGRYAVRYWLTDMQADDATDSSVRTLIDAALRRNDRRLTPPVFNVFMNTEGEYRDARHKRHSAERVAVLRQLPLFAMLDDDTLASMADSLKFTPFVQGDVMLAQGQVAEWLYIMVRGEADMLCRQPDGQELVLGRLQSGDFFGEMGLLMQAPSAYGVRAAGHVECYRVGREVFQQVFLARDALQRHLSDVLQQRLDEQQLLLQQHRQHAPLPRDGDLLAGLRSLFGWK